MSAALGTYQRLNGLMHSQDVSLGSSPLIARPALWLKLCRRVEQPAQEITVPKQVLHNRVAARFKHTCYYAGDLQ